MQSEIEELKKTLQATTEEYQKLKEEKRNLQERNQSISQQIFSQEDTELAIKDYENMIREIRQELEGKKNYDFWKLKIFYNKVASITNSTWEYPGVPKFDPFQPKSQSVQKFLNFLSGI